MRKVLSLLALAVLAASTAVVSLWPSSTPKAGYPLARRAAGSSNPLWQMPPEALETVLGDDTERLARSVEQLEKALEKARHHRGLLERVTAAELPSRDRDAIRGVWWSALEPLVFIDDLKNRYEAWWGVDYVKHPKLHARAFALGFTALCVELAVGHELVALVRGKGAQKLFDEAMPEYGLPSGTFTSLRGGA
jgi:hypothetical protein